MVQARQRLYHRAHCVQSRVEAHRLGLRGLQVCVIHGVLEGGLPVAALVAGVAVVLNFRSCSRRRRDKTQLGPQFEDKKTEPLGLCAWNESSVHSRNRDETPCSHERAHASTFRVQF